MSDGSPLKNKIIGSFLIVSAFLFAVVSYSDIEVTYNKGVANVGTAWTVKSCFDFDKTQSVGDASFAQARPAGYTQSSYDGDRIFSGDFLNHPNSRIKLVVADPSGNERTIEIPDQARYPELVFLHNFTTGNVLTGVPAGDIYMKNAYVVETHCKKLQDNQGIFNYSSAQLCAGAGIADPSLPFPLPAGICEQWIQHVANSRADMIKAYTGITGTTQEIEQKAADLLNYFYFAMELNPNQRSCDSFLNTTGVYAGRYVGITVRNGRSCGLGPNIPGATFALNSVPNITDPRDYPERTAPFDMLNESLDRRFSCIANPDLNYSYCSCSDPDRCQRQRYQFELGVPNTGNVSGYNLLGAPSSVTAFDTQVKFFNNVIISDPNADEGAFVGPATTNVGEGYPSIENAYIPEDRMYEIKLRAKWLGTSSSNAAGDMDLIIKHFRTDRTDGPQSSGENGQVHWSFNDPAHNFITKTALIPLKKGLYKFEFKTKKYLNLDWRVGYDYFEINARDQYVGTNESFRSAGTQAIRYAKYSDISATSSNADEVLMLENIPGTNQFTLHNFAPGTQNAWCSRKDTLFEFRDGVLHLKEIYDFGLGTLGTRSSFVSSQSNGTPLYRMSALPSELHRSFLPVSTYSFGKDQDCAPINISAPTQANEFITARLFTSEALARSNVPVWAPAFGGQGVAVPGAIRYEITRYPSNIVTNATNWVRDEYYVAPRNGVPTIFMYRNVSKTANVLKENKVLRLK